MHPLGLGCPPTPLLGPITGKPSDYGYWLPASSVRRPTSERESAAGCPFPLDLLAYKIFPGFRGMQTQELIDELFNYRKSGR